MRRYGMTALGGVYFNVPLTSCRRASQVPGEAMLGLRWYSSLGVTFTTGFNFGMDCGFSVPAFRFSSPRSGCRRDPRVRERSRAQKNRPRIPDGDGLIGEADHRRTRRARGETRLPDPRLRQKMASRSF